MNLNLGDTKYIIEQAASRGVLRNQLAYILATAYHESAHTMKPIKETVMAYHKDKFPSDATVKSRLENAYKKGQLGSVKTPYWRDGWFGRGYVQLTHKNNYDKLGVTQSQALERDHAIRVLIDGMMQGLFTGKKLSDYVTLKKSDFFNARAVVNGDKNYRLPSNSESNGNLIAGYARKYDKALKDAGYGESDVVVITEPVVADPEELGTPPAKSKTVWTWAGAAIMSGISGVGTFLGGLDWRVQLLFSVAIIGFAVYGIKRRADLFNAVKQLKEDL